MRRTTKIYLFPRGETTGAHPSITTLTRHKQMLISYVHVASAGFQILEENRRGAARAKATLYHRLIINP